jgi:hypothetical protein
MTEFWVAGTTSVTSHDWVLDENLAETGKGFHSAVFSESCQFIFILWYLRVLDTIQDVILWPVHI